MSDVNRIAPGFLTDQQRSSFGWLKNPTRAERLALRLDELFRMVGRCVGRWNDRSPEDRRHMRLAYGTAATLANWGKSGDDGRPLPLAVLGQPRVAVRIDDDLTPRQFEFRFEVSIMDAPDPEGAVEGTIDVIAGDIDANRQDDWEPRRAIAAVNAGLAGSN